MNKGKLSKSRIKRLKAIALIAAVQQLQPEERAKVAQALIQVDLCSDLTALIQELYAEPPVEDITNDEIMAEVSKR